MKSMTGYGTFKGETKDVSLEVSIRSVNGRFLETRVHMPREFSAFEIDLKKTLSETLRRGTVDVFISRKIKNQATRGTLQVNEALALDYFKAFEKLSKKLKAKYSPHVEVIARMPEVIKMEETSELSPGEEKLLKKVFASALKKCDQEREREGKALRKDMEKLLEQLSEQISLITDLREQANQQLQERFETKVKNRANGLEIDPQRLAQEIVIQLEKADINEELSRLSEHLKNYRELVATPQSEGKKLDFYTQELLREINTIGSKSQISKITQAVVESKTLVERLREQVQNVE
ncbi:MAG: YicC/YloC family endoribonuclease [Bdellovibrionia bacterium]